MPVAFSLTEQGYLPMCNMSPWKNTLFQSHQILKSREKTQATVRNCRHFSDHPAAGSPTRQHRVPNKQPWFRALPASAKPETGTAHPWIASVHGKDTGFVCRNQLALPGLKECRVSDILTGEKRRRTRADGSRFAG